MAKPVPDGYSTVTPLLTVRDGAKVIEFYTRAFGAQERFRMPAPDGRIAHAEIGIGDSVVMLSDEQPGMECRAPASVGAPMNAFYVYVPDVDAAFRRAADAGAKVVMPVADMFWGDRVGQVEDPSGYRWTLATHKEDLTPDEIDRRQRAWMASMAGTKR